MVYGSGLENQRTRKGTVSSNLTSSAIIQGVNVLFAYHDISNKHGDSTTSYDADRHIFSCRVLRNSSDCFKCYRLSKEKKMSKDTSLATELSGFYKSVSQLFNDLCEQKKRELEQLREFNKSLESRKNQ